jgi:hypothetical protein
MWFVRKSEMMPCDDDDEKPARRALLSASLVIA